MRSFLLALSGLSLLCVASAAAQQADPAFQAVQPGDYLGATEWHRPSSADDPSTLAKYEDGMTLWNAKAGPDADAKAVAAFLDAAAWAHPRAMYMLGLAHAEGRGAARDMTKAVSWFEKASYNGVGEAQLRYGVAMRDGLIGPREPEWGLAWIAKAANAGLPEAQRLYGRALAFGTGTGKDAVRAVGWLLIAENNGGGREDIVTRQALEAYMHEVDLATARHIAQTWKAEEWTPYMDEPMARFVQESLNALDGAGLTVDGKWNRKTARALKDYGKKRKVPIPDQVSNIMIETLRKDLLARRG